MILEFFDRFSKNAQISNLLKTRPVGAELLHADGRMTKLIAAFRNFANAPSDILNFLKCPFLQTLYLRVNLSLYMG